LKFISSIFSKIIEKSQEKVSGKSNFDSNRFKFSVIIHFKQNRRRIF